MKKYAIQLAQIISLLGVDYMTHIKYIDIERLETPETSSIFDHPDDEIIIEEKIDGGNGCFWLQEGQIHVASRNRDLTELCDEKTFLVQRKWLCNHLADKMELLDPNYRYYIEWMQKHTINYGKDISPIIGLDIRPIIGAFGRGVLFLGYRAKCDAFDKIGIPVVALKGIYKVKDLNAAVYDKLTEKSIYYDGKPEGIVLKNYNRLNIFGRQIFAKIVLEEFKETNRAVFGSAKKDTSDTVRLVETYCTEMRIRKRILSLVQDGGMVLDRKLMSYLPISVCTDIFKEETADILKNYKNISVVTLKQMIAKKCLAQIDIMIIEQTK